MAKIRCQECKNEIIRSVKIQEFDPIEPTAMHGFYFESCKDKWFSNGEK